MREGAPALLLAFFLAFGLLARQPSAPQRTVAPAANESEDAAEETSGGTQRAAPTADGNSSAGAVSDTADDPLQELLGEFRGADAGDIVFSDSTIVLVPDPLDSQVAGYFDQALEAIKSVYASREYLLDRFWLPWLDQPAKDKVYRDRPGLLLFRRFDGERWRPAAVVVVGENPKAGIHKQAFAEAVSLLYHLQGHTGEIAILGPSFSGSARSLRLAVDRAASDSPAARFRLVSGSATARALERELAGAAAGRASFCRAVLPDPVLWRAALHFFDIGLEWDAGRIAILTEEDTAYGRQDLTILPPRPPPDQGAAAARRARGRGARREVEKKIVPFVPIVVRFPSGLADVRKAWEDERPAKDEARQLWTLGGTSSRLDLSDRSQPVDVFREFDPLTTRGKELALVNLLAAAARRGARYFGVLATDIRDKIYLAERIGDFAPGAVLFTFEGDLLLSHSRLAVADKAMLVVGSFPTATESEAWGRLLGGPPGHYHRQFASEFQQGIDRGLAVLLAHHAGKVAAVDDLRVWVAAVGRGTILPVAALTPAELERYDMCGREGPPKPDTGQRPPLDRLQEAVGMGSDVRLALALAVLAVLALRLPRGVERGAPEHKAGGHLLPIAGLFLWPTAAVLAHTGFEQLAHSDQPLGSGKEGIGRLVVGWGLAIGYGLVVAWTARAAMAPARSDEDADAVKARWICMFFWGAVGALVLVAVPWLLRELWTPQGAGVDFVALRLRRFSSGLSPVLPLLWLSAAGYFWAFFEAWRTWSHRQQPVGWPFCVPGDAVLQGCDKLARAVRVEMGRLFPRSLKLWSGIALLVGIPVASLLAVVQPITEPRVWGRWFVLLCAALFVLALASFARFVRLWGALRRVLERLDYSRLTSALARLAPELLWSPTKSFAWQVPASRMLVLSVAKLKAIDPRGVVDVDGRKVWIAPLLERYFEADRTRDRAAEAEIRSQLARAFDAACDALSEAWENDRVADFCAVRVVAYLRQVFTHLRYSLLAALVPMLLLLGAIKSYAFEPKGWVLTVAWVALVMGVAVTISIFVQIDRNATLSAITGSTPGRVSFDRGFVTNVISYGLLPLLGIVLSLSPPVGRWLLAWVDPLVRILAKS